VRDEDDARAFRYDRPDEAEQAVNVLLRKKGRRLVQDEEPGAAFLAHLGDRAHNREKGALDRGDLRDLRIGIEADVIILKEPLRGASFSAPVDRPILALG
jgi:hypothetical protein